MSFSLPSRLNVSSWSIAAAKLWQGLDMTVEVEAKAKELAVKKLAKALKRRNPAK